MSQRVALRWFKFTKQHHSSKLYCQRSYKKYIFLSKMSHTANPLHISSSNRPQKYSLLYQWQFKNVEQKITKKLQINKILSIKKNSFVLLFYFLQKNFLWNHFWDLLYSYLTFLFIQKFRAKIQNENLSILLIGHLLEKKKRVIYDMISVQYSIFFIHFRTETTSSFMNNFLNFCGKEFNWVSRSEAF
jgi:hypothetical protein